MIGSKKALAYIRYTSRSRETSIPELLESSSIIPSEPSLVIPQKPPSTIPQESSLDIPQKSIQDIPQEPSQELPQEPSQPIRQELSQPIRQETSQPIPQETSVWRELLNLGVKIAAISIVFTLIFTFLYGLHRGQDPDMAPMIKDGDLLMFYRLDKDYAIGDLLVLDFHGARQARRVVARAGDIVDITEDGLIINGAIQQEPEIYQQTRRYEDGVSFPLTVGEGQVFVLGDSRENATDSRVYGPVNTDDTLGTVITVLRRRHM